MFVVKYFIRTMYAPANKVTETDRTSAKKETSGTQLNTFVDGRESTALQRALIDSIHQSAPRPGTGVVQRNKGDILDAHPELIGMPAQGFIRRLMAVAIEVQGGVALRKALTNQGLGFLGRDRNPVDAIGRFINTWNQDGETDLIDVADFFYFKTLLGEATPTEGTLAVSNLPSTLDVDVAYIGHDNGQNKDLDIGIFNFTRSQQSGEGASPQYLTLDLVSKHQTWSPQGNETFIAHLTSPYIKICHLQICQELVRNGGRKVSPGKAMGTRKEVNMLIDRGYEFVKPCLLLSPVLHVTGVDVRRLQRMGIEPELVVSQGWKLKPGTPGADDDTMAEPIRLHIVDYGLINGFGSIPSLPPCEVLMSQDHKFVAITQPQPIMVSHYSGGKVNAIIPQQLIWAFDGRRMPPIRLSGMDTVSCQVVVADDLSEEGYAEPLMVQICVAVPQAHQPPVFEFIPKRRPPRAPRSPAATPFPPAPQPPAGRGRRAPRANENHLLK